MRTRLATLLAVSLSATAFAQDSRDTVSVALKGKKATIEYGRAALKGRTLDALLAQLPDDRVWRTGVDQATTLTTETDLQIGGKKVPAGKYTVYVYAPKTGDWSFILNTDPGIELAELGKLFKFDVSEARAKLLWPRLDGYSKVLDKEVVRAPMKSGSVKPPVELFTITLKPSPSGAVATLSWGDKIYSIELHPAS
jgi:hypothetical protein